ncbi:hypothetical protein FGO68_gene10514 [Halteria grandinella]|uniref:Uncharacterized protein n=1 Tax=Halteria grandinella TaxID=5974 RepID=A0A8J8NES2_HALGN|nr:hypothetical protein FGO68_gene10514 [Halteria grandinella]
MKKSLLPQKRFDQEDSDSDSDRIEENDDEENERFNQEMFKKRKAEQDKDHSILAHLMQRRKSSSGGESSGSDDDMNDEEDRIFDMGVKVFDRRPMQSMLEKRARQQSPGQGEEKPVLYFNSNTKRISPSHSSSSSNGSPKVRTGAQPASNRMIQFVLESETKDHKEPPLLFTSDDFVEGGTLINPVTGEQKEPKQKEDDLSAFELLESQSVSGKRVKTESNGNSDEPQPSENKPESTEIIKEAHKEQEENHIEQKGGNE